MIYKFIDNNGSEITVNSLSSLQALVNSETVKENTKVKAGLRGKWTTAENIPELVFEEKKEETIEETIEPEGDIKSFITAEKKPEEVSTQPEQAKKEEAPVEKIEETVEVVEEEKKTEYELEEEKRDKNGDDKYTTEVVLQGFNSNLTLLDTRSSSNQSQNTIEDQGSVDEDKNKSIKNQESDPLEDDIPF